MTILTQNNILVNMDCVETVEYCENYNGFNPKTYEVFAQIAARRIILGSYKEKNSAINVISDINLNSNRSHFVMSGDD